MENTCQGENHPAPLGVNGGIGNSIMKIDLPEEQKQARPSDWRQLGDITAEAFINDPVNRWVFGTERGIKSAYRTLARAIYLRQGRCFLHEDAGATMWLEPGVQSSFSSLAMLRFALGMRLYGAKGALKRATDLGEKMDQHHPKDPHMYLFTIGTRASGRGKGVGKALLAPVLAACDRDKMAVYLENSNPDNHGFYRAHGFETMTKFELCEGGPVMEPMWREPR